MDLYCGIGIGSLGLVRAGFKIAAAVDIDSEACKIYKKNLKVAPIEGDLRKITGRKILGHICMKKGELDLVVGCPPCQGFSSLRTTRLKSGGRDNRKSLLGIFGDRISELLPKEVILENVRGLVVGKNRRYFLKFLRRLRDLGYNFAYEILDAANYGVPQHRYRIILFGIRGRFPVIPPPTHADPRIAKVENKIPWASVRSAISDLPRLRSGQVDDEIALHSADDHSKSVLLLFKNISKDGGSRRELPEDLWLPCHKNLKGRGAESVYGRLWWDRPSVTMTTGCHRPSCGRFIHPSQNRGISLREAARLQTIPDDYEITGGKERVATWIGNAIPADLAEQIGQYAIQYFKT